MITLDSTICNDLSAAASREWLETNGIGGFASGTVTGARSRRYHSLLTAATKPPLGRVSLLSKLEETLLVDGVAVELSTNHYPGAIHPRGFEYLWSFRLDPFPVWTFRIGEIELEKKLFMAHGANATVCRWTVNSVGRAHVGLRLRPLLSFVDYHHLRRESSAVNFEYSVDGGFVKVSASDMETPLYFHHDAEIAATGLWYRNFELAIERERGFDFTEDLYQPFALTYDISAGPADLIVATKDGPTETAGELEVREVKRRSLLLETAEAAGELEGQLVLAADQFIVNRGEGQTVIAGYPWFSDWGRDTMIALSGLTLATNRPAIARAVLLEFSNHISEGMLPNRFPDAGTAADYNTVDATLWYFEAIRAYIEFSGDQEFISPSIYEKLANVIAWHLHGTRYGIHVDTDGLLCAGEAGVQLTWMDAKVGDLVITPRTGKPVEIQALWFNALKIMASLAERLGHSEDLARFQAMAEMAKLSFNSVFWNAGEDCLFDVVENGSRDASVRPNQIFAVSLPFSMLNGTRSRLVLEKVTDELLTPRGLRSLSPRDARYVAVYTGSPLARDSAYHQGTVWGWLIGPYVDAFRQVNGRTAATEKRVADILGGFESHLNEAGLGQVSEIFDADAPHAPRGCPAQAWSVAELLRVLKNR